MSNNQFAFLSQLLGLPQPESYEAGDGTLWPTAGMALLHDILERHWEQHLEIARDGENIRTVRELLLRISQADLARAAGVSQPYIAMLEGGHRLATEKRARLIWEAFGRIANEQEAQQAKVEECLRRQITIRLEPNELIITEKMSVDAKDSAE
jgi:transcriptional regulator with XRE-family HTH domain